MTTACVNVTNTNSKYVRPNIDYENIFYTGCQNTSPSQDYTLFVL